MTCEIEIAGRRRRVAIERISGSPGRVRVLIDGRRHVVDVARTGEFGLSLLLASPEKEVGATVPETATASVEVAVVPGTGPGELLVTLEGRTVAATIIGRRGGRAAESPAHADGEQPVVAPMPGRVVRVLVAVGDEVAARQGVIVVEAMKMENELRAPKAGRIRDISVAAGASVEAGRVLVVIE